MLGGQKPHISTQLSPTAKLDIEDDAAKFVVIFTQPHETIPRQILTVAVMTPRIRIIRGHFAWSNGYAATRAVWRGFKKIEPGELETLAKWFASLTHPDRERIVDVGGR